MSNHLPQGLKKGYLQASGMEFRYFSSGPAGGQPVLMLHGFPSTSLMWGPQLEALGKEGAANEVSMDVASPRRRHRTRQGQTGTACRHFLLTPKCPH